MELEHGGFMMANGFPKTSGCGKGSHALRALLRVHPTLPDRIGRNAAPEMIGAPVGWQLQPASTLVLDTEARW